ncbi:MAG: hypothetical protein ABJB49_00150 [Nitrospirota bacterium]
MKPFRIKRTHDHMSSVITSSCPKCSFEYEAEAECQRCGIIFDRYKPSPPAPPASWVVVDAAPDVPDAGWFRKPWRAIQWAVVAVAVIAVVLILQESALPKVSTDPQAMQRAHEKIRDLAYASEIGRPVSIEMDAAELNAWLRSGLLQSNGVGQQQGSLRDMRMQLLDDHLRAHIVWAFLGTTVSLYLEGQVAVADGQLQLLPTRGKLGALPLPPAILKNMVARVFESPEQREQFQLPKDIAHTYIRDEELVISSFP